MFAQNALHYEYSWHFPSSIYRRESNINNQIYMQTNSINVICNDFWWRLCCWCAGVIMKFVSEFYNLICFKSFPSIIFFFLSLFDIFLWIFSSLLKISSSIFHFFWRSFHYPYKKLLTWVCMRASVFSSFDYFTTFYYEFCIKFLDFKSRFSSILSLAFIFIKIYLFYH